MTPHLGHGVADHEDAAVERWHQDNVPAARKLRRTETRSEQILWGCLRGRRFHNFKFRRQHPVGALVLDFYCEEFAIGIEIDGGVHQIPRVAENDCAREAALRETHIHLIRVSAADVERDVDSVLARIAKELDLE